MKFPKFGLFGQRDKVIVHTGRLSDADRSKRGRHSKALTTTKRKRSITYYPNKSHRFYPSDLFPAPPLGLPALACTGHSSSSGGGASATTMVPIHANVDGERHDLVWLPQQQRRSSLPIAPHQQCVVPHEEFNWPPSNCHFAMANTQLAIGDSSMAAAGFVRHGQRPQQRVATHGIQGRAMASSNMNAIHSNERPHQYQQQRQPASQTRAFAGPGAVATGLSASLQADYTWPNGSAGGEEWAAPAHVAGGRHVSSLGRPHRRKKVLVSVSSSMFSFFRWNISKHSLRIHLSVRREYH